jgi:hypothetical protein
MELLRKEDFLTLLRKPEGVAVSIYLPTHRVAETEGDPLKLRHLLEKAESALIEKGLRSPEARSLLAPARELLPDALFWQHQDESLALFLTPKSFRYFNLPVTAPEMMVVSDEFVVKPLLPLLSGDGAYYLLSLSLNHIALFYCREHLCREVSLPGVPKSLAEALKYDEPEKQLQHHTTGPGPAVFHGQGAPNDLNKAGISRFFQQVNRGLEKLLAGEKTPLVITGVDYLQTMFRAASNYPNILAQGVEGNPDRVNPDALQRQAWQVVLPYFLQEQVKALAQYVNATGQGPSVNDLAQVIPAAADGRVSVLFVAEGLQKWGAFDAAEHRVRLDIESSPGASDLIEYLVKQTLLTGGSVYTMKPEEMPSPTGVAAVLRY